MLVRRRLALSALAATSSAALGLGLLSPVVATAADSEVAASAEFTPTLTYVDCPVDEDVPARTKCAELTVPLDWQTPDDGRTVQIAVRVTAAKKPRLKIGGLTWNPGGPGGDAISSLPSVFPTIPKTIRDRFDFVTWDPRGVGSSEPKLAGCSTSEIVPPSTGAVDWEAYWQQVYDTNGASAAKCLADNPDAAPYLGTWQVVRDLDALRVAMGYDRWNYWGMSYGTRVGNIYARTFPGNLRAFVQDGPVMAQESITRFGIMTPAGLNASIQVFASVVGKKQAFKIRKVLRYLDDTVIDFGSGSPPLNRWTFLSSLNSNFRKPSLIGVARSLVNVSFRYVTAATSQEQKRARRALKRIPDVTQADPQSDTQLINLINCSDYTDRPSVDVLASMSRNAERAFGSAFGLQVARASMCFGLPADYSPNVETDNPTINLPIRPLFLLASGDAGTPWVWGRSMANTYARSRTVTLNSTEHVSFFRTPSTCVKGTAERYLLTLQLPPGDLFCPFSPYIQPER